MLVQLCKFSVFKVLEVQMAVLGTEQTGLINGMETEFLHLTFL